jgi:putative MFS transporter
MSSHTKNNSIFSMVVFVAALGYFVDIYDLLLFSIIRIPSLLSLNVPKDQVMDVGAVIISWQMWGLLVGGIIWGIMGDKKGRLSVLFGSILLYSLANIANGMVQDVDTYKWIRFIAGIGLAGELGAGITLVAEIVPKEKRGMATSLVAGIGLTGAVVAYLFSISFDWRTCYYVGGGMGLVLLLLRVSVFESEMYKHVHAVKISRGNFFMFFTNWKRFSRYILNIMIGLPTWLCIGILITFSPEIAKEMHVTGVVDGGKAVMFAYIAISIGDLSIGFISHWLKSRKKAVLIFYIIAAIFIVLFFSVLYHQPPWMMYLICAGIGLGTGFWAIFVTMAAEQFGTNLRATAATTIPNMVRGMLPVMILVRDFFMSNGNLDFIGSNIMLSYIVMSLSFLALYLIPETYARDLNFIEE